MFHLFWAVNAGTDDLNSNFTEGSWIYFKFVNSIGQPVQYVPKLPSSGGANPASTNCWSYSASPKAASFPLWSCWGYQSSRHNNPKLWGSLWSKTGPRLADFFSPLSPKEPLSFRPYSLRPMEQHPDPPTSTRVPESEPHDFIPNLVYCKVLSAAGESEETPLPPEPEQPARSWRIYDTRTQIVRTVTSSQLFRSGNRDQHSRRK